MSKETIFSVVEFEMYLKASSEKDHGFYSCRFLLHMYLVYFNLGTHGKKEMRVKS